MECWGWATWKDRWMNFIDEPLACDPYYLKATLTKKMIKEFEGRRPPSLDIFLEYVGIDEEQFYTIAIGHQVSPWEFDPKSQGTIKEEKLVYGDKDLLALLGGAFGIFVGYSIFDLLNHIVDLAFLCKKCGH